MEAPYYRGAEGTHPPFRRCSLGRRINSENPVPKEQHENTSDYVAAAFAGSTRFALHCRRAWQCLASFVGRRPSTAPARGCDPPAVRILIGALNRTLEQQGAGSRRQQGDESGMSLKIAARMNTRTIRKVQRSSDDERRHRQRTERSRTSRNFTPATLENALLFRFVPSRCSS